METRDDLARYLEDFGIEVTRASGASFAAIFDHEEDERVMDGEVRVIAGQPMLTCRTADVTGLNRGNELRIDGVTYSIRYITGDGSGMTTIYLQA